MKQDAKPSDSKANSSEIRALMPVLISVICWAAEYVLIKQACGLVRPLKVALVSTSVAALLYGFLLAVSGLSAISRNRLQKRSFPLGSIILIGLLGTAINLLCIWGTSLTTAANAAALGRTDILFALLSSTVLFRERIRRTVLMMVPLVLVGVYLITDVSIRALSVGNKGDFLILASTFLLVVNAGIIKRTMHKVSGPVIAGCNMTINALLFAGASIIFSGHLNILRGIPVRAWCFLVLCGACIFSMVMAYYSALKVMPVWEVFLLFLLVPVLTTLFAWGARDELPTFRQGFGMLLIMVGAAGIIISRRRGISPRLSGGVAEPTDLAFGPTNV